MKEGIRILANRPAPHPIFLDAEMQPKGGGGHEAGSAYFPRAVLKFNYDYRNSCAGALDFACAPGTGGKQARKSCAANASSRLHPVQ
jgi:hypothetical protein